MIIWKKGKFSVLFPIAICMPLFYLLWAKVISYTCSPKNMELIRFEFSSVNISTTLVNCCFNFLCGILGNKKEERIFCCVPHDVNSPSCVAWQMLVTRFYIIGYYLKLLVAVVLRIKKTTTTKTSPHNWYVLHWKCIINIRSPCHGTDWLYVERMNYVNYIPAWLSKVKWNLNGLYLKWTCGYSIWS